MEPYKRLKDKVALVGMAETTRHLAPWDDDEWEIWILNEMGNDTALNAEGEQKFGFVKRWDRLLQIHQPWDYMREGNFNDPDHPAWLTGKIARPLDNMIYMQEEYDGIPGAVRYPLDEIVEKFGERSKYFTNSFAYMIALALYMEYSTIGAWGFAMASETEYAQQKPCAEFWLGAAMGRGAKIVLPPKCPLLGEMMLLYGYEAVPEMNRMHLEIYNTHASKEVIKADKQIERLKGNILRIRRMLQMSGITKSKEAKLRRELQAVTVEHANAAVRKEHWRGRAYSYQQLMREMDMKQAAMEVKIPTFQEIDADIDKQLEKENDEAQELARKEMLE